MANSAENLLMVQLQPGGGYSVRLSGPEQTNISHGIHQRQVCLEPFLAIAAKQFCALGYPEACFAVQLDDEDPGPLCFRFDAPTQNDGKGPLIPDPYALGSNGFAQLRRLFESHPLPPWRQRLAVAIWRGSSTGVNQLCTANLDSNLRYQLCKRSLNTPLWLDARMTDVVQSIDQKEKQKLETLLCRQRILASRLTPRQMALHRWILDIDGNVNSWGLLWKLLSGSCVIRVMSQRQQWYHHQLEPWEHFIPVDQRLSDLEEALEWCFRHPADCEAIAHQGQQLGKSVVAMMEEAQRRAVLAYAQMNFEPSGREP